MPERLNALLKKVQEWWNNFTSKQKTVIIVVSAAAVLTLVILVSVFTRPTYVLLMSAENTKEASEVKDLLDGNDITYTISNDGLQFRVLESQEADANLLLGANDIQAADYSIDNVTNGSFSTTESDKQKKYVAYLEAKLASDFSSMDTIDNAKVDLSMPEDDGTLLANQQEASASILLQLADPDTFSDDSASYIAKAVAAAIGNKSTDNIVILDTEGNMLFAGAEDSTAGMANSQLSLKNKAEKNIKNEVKSVMLGTNLYDNVEVASNLVMDFSNKEETTHDYTPVEGGTQGVLSHEDTYNSENQNGTGGVPGTDTNDQTTYVTQDNENSTATVDEESKDYLPNEKITTTTTPAGVINYDESSISVTAINYVVVNQSDYKAADNGDLSWADYKKANSEPVDETDTIDKATSDRLVNVIANATGISGDRITLALYSQNVFFDSTGANFSVSDILQIVLILCILGMLAFVIIRSLRTSKEAVEEEQPEELSVEQLLESQPQDSMGNIEVEEGSETKKLIEKFVDENPEAAANLLRNWLNEDEY